MAKELLNGPYVIAFFNQVGREAVTERVNAGLLDHASRADGFSERSLKRRGVEVKAPRDARHRIHRYVLRRENPVPTPFLAGVRILPVEGSRGHNAGKPVSSILFEKGTDLQKVSVDFLNQLFWEDGLTVLVPFGAPDCQAISSEIDILHPKAKAFFQSHAAAIDQSGHQKVRPAEMIENSLDFFFCENDRELSRYV